MASPVLQSSSENQGETATPTITEPASATTGDLLIAVVGNADTGTAISGLTGWTQLGEGDDGQGNRYWYGWIIRGGSAPDLVAASADAKWVAMCVRIDGHDATTPIGSDHATTNGTGTSPNGPNVTPGASRDHLAVVGVVQEGKDDNRFTDANPTGYTEQADIGSTGGGGGTSHIGGAMNSKAYTGQAENPNVHLSSRNDGWIAITMIVRPAAGTTNFQTIAVSSTMTPAVVRQISKFLAVVSSMSAVIVRKVSKFLAVTSSMTAVILKKVSKFLAVSSTMTAALAVAKFLQQAVAATTTMTAAVAKLTTRYRTLAVGSAMAATVGKLTTRYRTLAVNSTMTAVILKQVSKFLAVTSSMTAAIVRQTSKFLAVASTMTAGLTPLQVIGKLLAVSSTMTAVLSREVTYLVTLAVGSAFAVSMGKMISKTLAVTSTFGVAMLKQMFQTLGVAMPMAAGLDEVITFLRAIPTSSTMTAVLATLKIPYDPGAVTRVFKRSFAAIGQFFHSGG